MRQVSDLKWLALSAGISSIGTAASTLFIPLLIFAKTKSPLITALQVTMHIIGSLVACQLISRIKFGSTDKSSLFFCNLLLSATTLSMLSAEDNYLVFGCFLLTFMNSIIHTCGRGYYESIIGALSELTKTNRQSVIGTTKAYENFGTIIGSCFAGPLLVYSTSSTVFILDSLTFLIAAVLVNNLTCEGNPVVATTARVFSMSLLFTRKIRALTISHGLIAAALFLMNGSIIYVLKESFNSDDVFISMFYVSQFVFSFIGALTISKIAKSHPIDSSKAQWLRLTYAVPFVIISVNNSVLVFAFMISFLAFIHAFSLPVWQSCFQDSAEDSSDWRLIGATRKTYVSIVGGLASLLAGMLLTITDYKIIYLLAAIFCGLSVMCFSMFSKKMEQTVS